ncbi:MAG: hypothetical protein P8J33_08335, partial [Pirellulaceae bacterium]|nr:hypothetical protein [Pirellulaceae bacterium]
MAIWKFGKKKNDEQSDEKATLASRAEEAAAEEAVVEPAATETESTPVADNAAEKKGGLFGRFRQAVSKTVAVLNT